jgi:exopolyphosphatase/guanosine-5'-triphosphate,3'-diphosphate pyrophosphatase
MYASIDIGTHSVLLLIANVAKGGAIKLVEDRIAITRLGEGLGKTKLISEAAANRTIEALAGYLEICRMRGAGRIKAVGTAALRTAKNAKEFVARAKKELGVDIEVISEDKEARLTYEASAADFGKEIIVVDIGGGSTEFIKGPKPLKMVSVPMGSVSLTERYIKSDPPSEKDEKALRHAVASALKKNVPIDSNEIETVVATAGTATTLMSMYFKLEAYNAKLVHGQHLSIDDLDDLISHIASKKLEERKKMPGLMPERAEVIFAGAVILHEAMKFFECREVTISDRGVRWGVFYEEFTEKG